MEVGDLIVLAIAGVLFALVAYLLYIIVRGFGRYAREQGWIVPAGEATDSEPPATPGTARSDEPPGDAKGSEHGFPEALIHLADRRRSMLEFAAIAVVAAWVAFPWFSTPSEQDLGASESFSLDQFLLLGAHVSWPEIGLVGVGVAGISAFFGDRFGPLLGFAAFLGVYGFGRYALFEMPEAVGDAGSREIGIWVAFIFSLLAAWAALDLEKLQDARERLTGHPSRPPTE